MPAFALMVAFVPFRQEIPLSDEQMNPPVQLNGVSKSITPGAEPAKVPVVIFIVVAEMVSTPVPKSIVAPAKFTVPVPLIGPLCMNKPLVKAIVAPVPAVYIPGQPEPQFPPPLNASVPLLPNTVPVLLKVALIVLVPVPVGV